VKVRQKNVRAYLGGRDLCAEIHLSKADFKAEDEKLFDDLLSSVRLLPEEQAAADDKKSAAAARLIDCGPPLAPLL
jgi:hypothetical protein